MNQPIGSTLRDATVLVTGGARRVGAAIVRALHAHGANVVIHCRRSQSEAAALAAALDAERAGSALVLAADLLEESAPERLVAGALAQFGRLDVLVNNASSFYATPLDSLTASQWNDLVGTNLRAPLFLAQAAAAALRRSRGLILNLADVHGLRPLRDYCAYSIAKAGLIQLTRALARELAPEVRVNAIAPGPVLWPEGEAELDEARRREILARTPLGRHGSPADVARAACYFALDAPFVTGQVLAVDGGRSLGW